MTDEKPTFKNIVRETLSPGYWDRARDRKRASKTWWDAIFTPIGFGFWLLYSYGFSVGFWQLHVLLFPADHDRFTALFGGSMTLASSLMLIVPFFGAMPLGFMTSNALMWLVPWARRASEEKAEGVKWASIKDSQMALLRVAFVLVPITLVCGVVGARLLGR